MGIAHSLLPELDMECVSTRKTLERVPDEKWDWKPHEKSFSMGALASHVATLPIWGVHTISMSSLDVAPPDGPPLEMPKADSQEELLAMYDTNFVAMREAIESATDEQLMQPWTLLKGGKEILTMPKIAVLRGFVLNHTVHHRAQLGVYLRLNDIAVPSVYGPSADEGMF